MSMIANFKSVTPAQLDEIKNNPAIIESIIYPETESPSNDDELDIDKSWEGIHFILAGHKIDGGDPPLRNVIMGGTEIGEDVGYGPARYLEPEEVKYICAALENFSEDDFKKNFIPEKIQKASVYPFFDGKPNERDLDYLLSYYNRLKAFYQNTAAKGNGLLLYVN